MGTFWQKEQFKFIFKFSDINNQLEDYTVSTDQRLNSSAFVPEVDFDFVSSQSSPSVLFTMQASSNQLTIYDVDGQLNPNNQSSPYYSLLGAGIKVLAYIAAYQPDIEDYTWESYGVWFTSNWRAGMDNGAITAVTVGCDDILSEISSISVTNTEYSGSTAREALIKCLTVAGLESTDYTIDSSLDLNFVYTKLKDNVASTINDILTLAMGYCTVKHNGKIEFMHIQQISATAEEYEVGSILSALTLNISSSLNYGKVKVNYPNGSNSNLIKVLHDYSTIISNGTNNISIDLPEGLRSIEALRVKLSGCVDNEQITDISYILAGAKLNITIAASLTSSRTAIIDVYATTPASTAYNEVVVSLTDVVSANSYIYEYKADYATTANEAQAIANNLKDVLTVMRTQISCGTSMLSPYINVGDTLIIDGVSDEYDGSYEIISFSIRCGSTYNTAIKLLKYSEEE